MGEKGLWVFSASFFQRGRSKPLVGKAVTILPDRRTTGGRRQERKRRITSVGKKRMNKGRKKRRKKGKIITIIIKPSKN